MSDETGGTGAAGEQFIDVVNTLSLVANTDTRHRLHHHVAGELRSLTLAEVDARAVNVAHHLRALGVQARDRVGVLSRNSLEWVLLDLALIKLGAVTAGFEPGRFDADQVLRDYGLKLLFTEEAGDGGARLDMARVAVWADDFSHHGELPFHEGYDPADILSVKFTSGSTGSPKGLEVTVASVNSSLHEVQRVFAHGDGDNLMTFLGNWFLQQRYWVYSALVHGHDVTVARIDDAVEVAQAASPTVVMGVPGFYEGVRAALEARGLPADADKRRELIQAELGGRVRYLWTGSAPAGRTVLEFFNEAGVPLYEGYGLNETCIVAKNHPGAFRLGSVGKVLPNKTVRFDRDGILIVGSRHPVNQRYTWCAAGVNEKMFLPTGEVKTYDVGHIDEDGFLFIHGRVDDILTVGLGYNVLAPPIEEEIRRHPAVHDCVLYGSGKDFLSVVVSPASPAPDPAALSRHMAEVNTGQRAEGKIHGIVIAAERFSMENGLLTTQFKPRRRDIHRRYADDLSRIYQNHSGSETAPSAEHPLVIMASGAEPGPAEPEGS
ncbi:AMP-binding protein [Streptomyces griseoluteus]|uniref:AMP-binding protein n=1 Tax=Streptomyces griseoluteus TaxID=29306 RepID=UPI003325306A